MFVSSPPVENEIPILIHGNGIRQTTFQTLSIIMSPQRDNEKFEHIHTTSTSTTPPTTAMKHPLSQTTEPLTYSYRNRWAPRSASSRRCHRRRRPQMDLTTPNQSSGRYKSRRVPTISPRLAPRGAAGKVYGEISIYDSRIKRRHHIMPRHLEKSWPSIWRPTAGGWPSPSSPRPAPRGRYPLAEATPCRLLAVPLAATARWPRPPRAGSSQRRADTPRARGQEDSGRVLLPRVCQRLGPCCSSRPRPPGDGAGPPGSPPLRPEATQVAGSGSGVAPAHREALARHLATPPQIRRSTTSAERARRRQTPATAVWPHRVVGASSNPSAGWARASSNPGHQGC